MAEVINASCLHKDGSPELVIGIRDGSGIKILYAGNLAKITNSNGSPITIECELKFNEKSQMSGKIAGDILFGHEQKLLNLEGRVERLEGMAHQH